MPVVRPIIKIDVQDEQFKAFLGLFEKYKAALDKLPAAWGTVNKASGAGKSVFVEITAALMAQAELLHKAKLETERLSHATQVTGRGMRALVGDTYKIMRNIEHATFELLKWTGITTAIGGLLGSGGLFGIDRLAASAGGMRRSAMGIGTTPGAQQAFDTTFGQAFDSSLLGNVSAALTDLDKRMSLMTMLSSNEMLGDTTDVAVRYALRLKQKLGTLPIGQTDPILAQKLKMWQANGIVSQTDAQRWQHMTPEEVAEDAKLFAQRRKSLEYTDPQLKAWKDLDYTLQFAGHSIKAAFIDGLAPLVQNGTLNKLSNSFSKFLADFIRSDAFTDWVKAAETSLAEFATYITTPEFKHDVKDFITNVGKMADKIGDVLKFLGLWPSAEEAPKKGERQPGDSGWGLRRIPWGSTDKTGGGLIGGGVGGSKQSSYVSPTSTVSTTGNWEVLHNNFAGIRRPGVIAGPHSHGFMSYATPEEGIIAIGRLLDTYQQKHGLNTLSELISRWAPPASGLPGVPNDTAGLISRAVLATGFSPNQQLDLHDPTTRLKVIEAFIRNEQGGRLPVPHETIENVVRSSYLDNPRGRPTASWADNPPASPSRVQIDVNNATGGSATINANMVAQ